MLDPTKQIDALKSTPWWLSITIAAAAIVGGCEKPETLATVPSEQLRIDSGRWSCEENPRANHYVKACNVEINLDTARVDS